MLKAPEIWKLYELVFEVLLIVSENLKMSGEARALFIVFVLIGLNQIQASTECKNTVMDVIMENCHGFGSRFKRQISKNKEDFPKINSGTFFFSKALKTKLKKNLKLVK